MNSVAQQYNYQILISICPDWCACITCMSKGVKRKKSSAGRVVLNRHCIPAKSPSIIIKKAILSLVESINGICLIYSGSISMKPSVEMYLHVSLHIFNNREKACMSCNSFKKICCWIVYYSSQQLSSCNFIDKKLPLYSVGAIL